MLINRCAETDWTGGYCRSKMAAHLTVLEPAMNAPLMQTSNRQDVSAWVLPAGRVQRVPALPVPRWLMVERGRVWLTPSRAQGAAEDDVWLEAGQGLRLPARSSWLLEAWPDAVARLVEEPPRAA